MELLSVNEKSFTVGKPLFRKKEILFEEIEKIIVAKTLSLIDEIAIFLYCPDVLLIADSSPQFLLLAEKLDLNNIFGEDWYRRVEQGDKLEKLIKPDEKF